MATLSPSNFTVNPPRIATIFRSDNKLGDVERTHLKLLTSLKSNPAFILKASKDPLHLTQEVPNSKVANAGGVEKGDNLFDELKHRFLSFKKQKYLENLEHFETLAKGQAPKFLVIACADSRVCPSTTLGFQPGEAFIVRNVANLVPRFENPSETSAALEFAVNTLQVENILVIGHSCCGGIRALMSMDGEVDSSFIKRWVIVGKNAKLSTKANASNLSFDQQCKHCEKESINRSLLNLLSYPWIEEKVMRGTMSIHGGYYDFVDCTFEKWTLDYNRSSKESGKYSVKDRVFWC